MKHRIKFLREMTGWSANDLARRVHVTERTIVRWELGESHPHWASVTALNNLFRRHGIPKYEEGEE